MLFTPHERRAVIFLGAAFFCGICLDIFFKLQPPAYQALRVLDQPLSQVRVDVNKATYEELLKVHGIGPSTAARIIYARQEKGRFASLDDLRGIKGFSKRMFDRAAPHLTAGRP